MEFLNCTDLLDHHQTPFSSKRKTAVRNTQSIIQNFIYQKKKMHLG